MNTPNERLATWLCIAGLGPGDEAVSYTHLDVYKRQPFGRCTATALQLKTCWKLPSLAVPT